MDSVLKTLSGIAFKQIFFGKAIIHFACLTENLQKRKVGKRYQMHSVLLTSEISLDEKGGLLQRLRC